MMLGLRGFPKVQGGVETHAEHLCPLLVEMGCDVTVLVRSSYQSKENSKEWMGVKFVSIWAPKSLVLEAIIHSFIGMFYAALKRPDILHIHAIGPAIITLPSRLLGLKVVVTHHSQNYDHQKWGRFGRFVLRLGEYCGMRWSNERIVISKNISELVYAKYRVNSTLIPNGVCPPKIPASVEALDFFDLTPRHYVLLVGRLVPEKRHLDLISAFKLAALKNWKLVIVGSTDHPSTYEHEVIEKATEAGIVMTGFQQGRFLQELYANAGVFVLPSSHEGLPIVLLEALSYGLLVLASDIPANLEVCLPKEQYFPLGNIAALADKLLFLSRMRLNLTEREIIRERVTQQYDWREIAKKTLGLYVSCLCKNQ